MLSLRTHPYRSQEWMRTLFVGALAALTAAVTAALAVMGIYVVIPFFLALLLLAAAWSSQVNAEAPVRYLFLGFVAVLITLVLWPRYAFVRLPGFPGLNPERALYGVLLLLWVVAIFRYATFGGYLVALIKREKSMFMLLALYLLWRALSVFTSTNPLASFIGFLNELISYYLLFVLTVTILRKTKDVENALVVLVIATALVCAIGIVEAVNRRNLFIDWLPITSEYLEETLREKVRDNRFRIQGTFSHPLLFAEFLSMIAPIAVFFAFQSRRFVLSTLGLITLALMIPAIYLTGSRAGAIAAGAAIVALVAFWIIREIRGARKKLLFWILLFSLPCVLILATFIADTVIEYATGRSQREVNSAYARIDMWARGLTLVGDRPLFGYGIRQAAHELGYVGARGILTIDSYPLSLLLESGWPGLFLLVLFFVVLVASSVAAATDGNTPSAALVAALAAGIIGFLTTKLVLSTPHNFALAMVMTGMLVVSRTERVFSTIREQWRAPPKHPEKVYWQERIRA